MSYHLSMTGLESDLIYGSYPLMSQGHGIELVLTLLLDWRKSQTHFLNTHQ